MPEAVSLSPRQIAIRRARRHGGLLIGGSIVLLLVFMAVAAPLIAPYDPFDQDLLAKLRPPIWDGGSWDHLLGTDATGRDFLSRLIYGARVSIAIGFFAALVSAVIGSALGVIGGYYGGRIDTAVMTLVNIKLALPGLLVALALVQVFGGSMLTLILVISLFFWDRYAIVTRTLTLQLRSQEFMIAAKAAGASDFRILFRELLPNLFNVIIVVLTLEMALAIIVEAALSFLGLGIQPPTPSWGLMISEGRQYMFFRPHLVFVPGVLIFLLAISINLVGDGLRDVTAPEDRR